MARAAPGAPGALVGQGATGVDAAGGAAAPVDSAADKPASPLFDAIPPDGIMLGDGGPTVTVCAADVATATCATGNICVRPTTSGEAEACGCTNLQRWFCPGWWSAAMVGVSLPDAGAPDVAGIAACATGTASGVTCPAQGEVCRGAGSLGCYCTTLAGGLRWVCF